MNYRVLGRTGLQVSEVGFGAWAIGGNEHGNSYGPTDDQVSRRAIRRALELGCTFFDTADVYGFGHSEELLGEVIGNDPKVTIATKVGGNFYPPEAGRTVMDFSPKYIRFAVEQSLKRLRRDAIDLYQLHNPSLPLLQDGKLLDPMEKLREEGKVRFIGVSIFKPEEGFAAIRSTRIDTIQVRYNLFFQEPAQELFPVALQCNIGIIAREPLANGFLSGKYQPGASFPHGDIRHHWPPQYRELHIETAQVLRDLALAGKRTMAQAALSFVLDNDAVSVVIPGAKTPEQVEENLGAARSPRFTAEELALLYRWLSGA